MKKIEIMVELPDKNEAYQNHVSVLGAGWFFVYLFYWLIWLFLAGYLSVLVLFIPFALSFFHKLAKDYHPTRYR